MLHPWGKNRLMLPQKLKNFKLLVISVIALIYQSGTNLLTGIMVDGNRLTQTQSTSSCNCGCDYCAIFVREY